MKTNLTIIVSLLVFNFFLANQSFSQKTKELKFNKIIQRKNKVDIIIATLKIDTVQSISEQGIKFTVKIKNDSSANISIMNPLDFLYLNLKDRTGEDILKVGPSRYLINRRSKFQYTSFTIERVMINGLNSQLNLNDEKTIIIPSNSIIEIFLAIKNKNIKENNGAEDNPNKISMGQYKFSASLFVNQEGIKDEILVIDPVMISYGKQ